MFTLYVVLYLFEMRILYLMWMRWMFSTIHFYAIWMNTIWIMCTARETGGCFFRRWLCVLSENVEDFNEPMIIIMMMMFAPHKKKTARARRQFAQRRVQMIFFRTQVFFSCWLYLPENVKNIRFLSQNNKTKRARALLLKMSFSTILYIKK